MIKNKKGQFFLVMAVLIGVVLLGATSIYNSSKTTSSQDNFNLICDNYYYETQQLNKDCLITANCNFNEKLAEFTNSFLEGREDIGLIYWYGKNDEWDIQKFNTDTEDYWGRVITISEQIYNTLHFIMRQEKGKEVYFCEK